MQFSIQPVHVLNAQPEYTSPINAIKLPEYANTANMAVERTLKKLKVHSLTPAVIIDENNNPPEALEAFARKLRSPLILLSSHGRKGLNKLFLGSFAEKILQSTKRPILFIPKNSSHPKNRILFATDFSAYSRKAWQQFLQTAKALQYEIILYHILSNPPVLNAGNMWGEAAAIVPIDFYRQQKRRAQTMSARWLKEAKTRKIKVRFILEEQASINVADLLLKAAKKEQVAMIVAASTSSSFTRFMAGSVARNLFKANNFAVWIYGPQALGSAKKITPQSNHALAA